MYSIDTLAKRTLCSLLAGVAFRLCGHYYSDEEALQHWNLTLSVSVPLQPVPYAFMRILSRLDCVFTFQGYHIYTVYSLHVD